MSEHTLKLINDIQARWIDLRFTDFKGKEHHLTIPASEANDSFFEQGKMFDGSSVAGWKGINESDMVLLPDDSASVIDPFTEEPTVIVRCNVVDPITGEGYNRDPRSISQRAMDYLKATGIADSALFGPEPEFFVFDDVKWHIGMGQCSFEINSEEAAWASNRTFASGNMGHRPGVKGGYVPVPPVDSLHELRTAMCNAMEAMGLVIEIHHHEVATAGQCEIGVGPNTLIKKADEVQILKYCVHNVAHAYGKTATFMPKPIVGDNGSGMHVHQSLSKDGKNIFSGDAYFGLSETALYYIGGIIKHARAINAFTNPGTNSYKRLVPGYEAPVMLAYSARNRSASIRIPFVSNAKAARIEARFPDPLANPYLAFTALLMAGLDGIQNKIHPGDPADKDLYDLPAEEAAQIPTVASSLEMALAALDADRGFLTAGGVMDDDTIDAYITMKQGDVERINGTTHPLEFEMYYSC